MIFLVSLFQHLKIYRFNEFRLVKIVYFSDKFFSRCVFQKLSIYIKKKWKLRVLAEQSRAQNSSVRLPITASASILIAGVINCQLSLINRESPGFAANLPERFLLSWHTFNVFFRFFILLFSHTVVVFQIKFPGFWVLGDESYVKAQ